MLKANQPDGFDCPGCAWGDPEHGSSFEFCENGVKAVAWESTEKRVAPDFFASHSVTTLREWSDFELEREGRLTHPMRYDPATDCYVAVEWDQAFAEIGAVLRSLDNPNRAEFYTSGRASNEAAFLYQLFVRLYGTNNFPDCSNMCHEASGVALTQAVGVGKGTVLLEDFEQADAVFVLGQNPGTNHPRMLGDLRRAAERGAKIVVFNPVRERGLERFADPQRTFEMLRGGSGAIASLYLQPRLGGDMAAVRGMAKHVFARDAAAIAAGQASLLDHAFLAEHTADFAAYRAMVEATGWDDITDQAGLDRDAIEQAAEIYLAANSVICTWAMGITQHRHSVATIREITNFLLLRGNFARATPDSALTAQALQRQQLTVHVATKLNHCHLLPGTVSYILPCLGRTEVDRNSQGVSQIVTVEDSMSMVHGSGGINPPASPQLLSEVRIVAGIAAATVGSDRFDWAALADDNDKVRDLIARVVPGFADFNQRVRRPRGFHLRNAAAHREWNTPTGKANFSSGPLPVATECQAAGVATGQFVLQTFRSHDQYNTTIYGLTDRYRGIYGQRQVVFINPADIELIGAAAGDLVDVVGLHDDGVSRIAEAFRLVAYDIPRGCIAGYYPELNVLVPLSTFGAESFTPTSKSVVVRLRRHLGQEDLIGSAVA